MAEQDHIRLSRMNDDVADPGMLSPCRVHLAALRNAHDDAGAALVVRLGHGRVDATRLRAHGQVFAVSKCDVPAVSRATRQVRTEAVGRAVQLAVVHCVQPETAQTRAVEVEESPVIRRSLLRFDLLAVRKLHQTPVLDFEQVQLKLAGAVGPEDDTVGTADERFGRKVQMHVVRPIPG